MRSKRWREKDLLLRYGGFFFPKIGPGFSRRNFFCCDDLDVIKFGRAQDLLCSMVFFFK